MSKIIDEAQCEDEESAEETFSTPKARVRQAIGGGPAGTHSNRIITERNGGVVHQFLDDIGGCSANYR